MISDPKKVEAFKKYHQRPVPVNYQMRLLQKKDVLLQWTESHEVNFQKLKESFSSHACLIYFDTSKPVTLQVYASQVG